MCLKMNSWFHNLHTHTISLWQAEIKYMSDKCISKYCLYLDERLFLPAPADLLLINNTRQ